MTKFNFMPPAALLVHAGVFHPPVDLWRIVQYLGLQVSLNPDFNKLNIAMESYSPPAYGGVDIWLNPFEYQAEQRFSLAYEIGYIMVATRDGLNFNYHRQLRKKFHEAAAVNNFEYSAAEYASELLMPTEMVQKYGQDIINHNNSVSGGSMGFHQFLTRMAELFDVPPTVMEQRLYRLGVPGVR